MTDRKSRLIYFIAILAIVMIYILLFNSLSLRETSTLIKIRKDLLRHKENNVPVIADAKSSSINLPFYLDNESLISYSIRMTILKQKGFWQLNLSDIFKKRDLFKNLRPRVDQFETSFINKGNSIQKIESLLRHNINNHHKDVLLKDEIFTEALKLKLFYYNISQENTLSLNNSFLENCKGRYLLLFSMMILLIAAWNYNRKIGLYFKNSL